MLVLSRKVGQSLNVGEDIIVTVCRIRGGRVQIGISAPSDISIQRQEVNTVPGEEIAGLADNQRATSRNGKQDQR